MSPKGLPALGAGERREGPQSSLGGSIARTKPISNPQTWTTVECPAPPTPPGKGSLRRWRVAAPARRAVGTVISGVLRVEPNFAQIPHGSREELFEAARQLLSELGIAHEKGREPSFGDERVVERQDH